MFKFIYSYYLKNYKFFSRGFILTIDDEFDNFEVCILDQDKKIISNNYYEIKKDSLKNICSIIENNLDVFTLNSYIDNDEISYEEFTFYFEINKINREIKVFNFVNQNKQDINLLNKIFIAIKEVLFQEGYLLSLDDFK